MHCETTMYNLGVLVRCTKEVPHQPREHEFQSPNEAAEQAIRIAFVDTGADIAITWCAGRIASISYGGRPLSEDEWAFVSKTALPLMEWDGPPKLAWSLHNGSVFRCNVCKKVVPVSRGADDDMPEACDGCWSKANCSPEERHGATLAANCGFEWKELSTPARSVWASRARRLRRCWGVDELGSVIDADVVVASDLRSALCGEPEWKEPTLDLAAAAARAIRRLRSSLAETIVLTKSAQGIALTAIKERDAARALADGWKADAQRLLDERDAARANRSELSAQFGRLAREVCAEKEWREATVGVATGDVAVSVIRRLRAERQTIADAAKNLVAAWERHGLSGIASHVYDLRTALEKTK